MDITIASLCLAIVLSPLFAAVIVGLWRNLVGQRGAHSITLLGVGISLVLSAIVFYRVVCLHEPEFSGTVYTWAIASQFSLHVGFLVDALSASMLLVVTFVSFLVHIYTIGYMAEDPGYQRFFSYISLFTFAMLMLVLADNFLQLFFGWEGVGLVSYLLISFWYHKPSATAGGMKAFIVNRVGDLGFLLGIGLILANFNTLDYGSLFQQVATKATTTISLGFGTEWSLLSVIGILLFIGAMGKSAQVPLHVWLPESMEGPTPISALIHAATMVTAGVYMVARLSPLYEYAPAALSFVLVIGATGALFLGLVAIVQYDIKRVVAYSTLSQLGYMMAGLGASAYSAGIFHLMTHACFKALLFLGAGSVIMAMHHEQDIRRMGGLWRYLPITYVTFLLGTLSLVAIPPFSGFYSKDAVIEAVHLSQISGASYAYICVLLGAFVTAVYSFRVFFLTFHTQERMDAHTREHLHESPAVVYWPLILLAIPSVVLGASLAYSYLFAEQTVLAKALFVAPQHDVMHKLAEEYTSWWGMALHAVCTAPFWLAIAGIFVAWWGCLYRPDSVERLKQRFRWAYQILVYKFGFDEFYERVWVSGALRLGSWLYRVADSCVIDGYLVNGSAKGIAVLSRMGRQLQTGLMYHYALAMILGLLGFLALWFWRLVF